MIQNVIIQTPEEKAAIIARAIEIGAMDYSMMSTFDTCEELYNNIYEVGLFEPVSEKALFSSHIIHKGMQFSLESKFEAQIPYSTLWADYVVARQRHNIERPILETSLAHQALEKMSVHLYNAYIHNMNIEYVKCEHVRLDEDLGILSKPDLEIKYIGDPPEVAPHIVLDYKVNYRNGVMLPAFHRQVGGQLLTTGAEMAIILKAVVRNARDGNHDVDVIAQDFTMPADILERVKAEWKDTRATRDAAKARGTWRHNDGACYRYGTTCWFMGLCSAGVFKERLLVKEDNPYEKINPLGYLLE